MIEKNKFCSDVAKKYFNKELVMTAKDNEDFENSTKCWISDNDYIDNGVRVRDHCHITGKYRASAHKYVKLNHKNPVVFHSLKNYDSNLIMQELGKFNFKINDTLSFQFLSSSLVGLVKTLSKDFKYLSQEFDNNILNLVKQKGFL